MIRIFFQRIVESLFVLSIGSVLCFAFIRILPGDPAAAMYGDQLQKLNEAERLRISENLGLNEALPIQYIKWIGQVFQGEWGHSIVSGIDAATVVAQSLQPTFLLLLASQFLILLLAIFFGVSTALKQGSLYDHAVTVISFIFLSIPPFWFALMLMIFFSVHLGMLPTSGMGDGQLRYILLPSLVLALSHAGYYIRLLRNHIIITQDSGFIFALKARGFSKWKIVKNHLLPNASIPLLSYAGVSLAVALASSVVVETIFSWPGLGRLALKSALAHDYPVLLAIIMLSMAFVILVNLFVDLLCAWIDPRLRNQMIKEGK